MSKANKGRKIMAVFNWKLKGDFDFSKPVTDLQLSTNGVFPSNKNERRKLLSEYQKKQYRRAKSKT